MKYKTLFFLLILAPFFSCSAVRNPIESPRAKAFGASRFVAMSGASNGIMADSAISMDQAAYKDVALSEEATSESGAVNGDVTQKQPKKIIKNGSVTIEVPNFTDIEQSITKWAEGLAGYVSQYSTYEQNCNFTVRIPAARFDSAISTIGDIGVLKERSVSSNDVSEQYYDLQTRLNNKLIMKEKLEKYLSQAKDVKDMLQIEVELNNAITDIENMTGRMKRLSGQIDYSTINVNAVLPYGVKSSAVAKPKFTDGVRRFVTNAIRFFPKCFIVLLYIIICGIPVLAIISFLYWLLLGRVGLLKRLYKWLSK